MSYLILHVSICLVLTKDVVKEKKGSFYSKVKHTNHIKSCAKLSIIFIIKVLCRDYNLGRKRVVCFCTNMKYTQRGAENSWLDKKGISKILIQNHWLHFVKWVRPSTFHHHNHYIK